MISHQEFSFLNRVTYKSLTRKPTMDKLIVLMLVCLVLQGFVTIEHGVEAGVSRDVYTYSLPTFAFVHNTFYHIIDVL